MVGGHHLGLQGQRVRRDREPCEDLRGHVQGRHGRHDAELRDQQRCPQLHDSRGSGDTTICNGDYVDVQITPAGTPAATRIAYAVIMTPS
jgi:hypothetical protein